jgi:hypothetical protein
MYKSASFSCLVSIRGNGQEPLIIAAKADNEEENALVESMVYDDIHGVAETLFAYNGWRQPDWEDCSLYIEKPGIYVVSSLCWGSQSSTQEGTEYDSGIDATSQDQIHLATFDEIQSFYGVLCK